MTDYEPYLAEEVASGRIDFADAMGEAAGAVSVCWVTDPDDFQTVFDSERAVAIMADLQQALANAIAFAVRDAKLGEATGWDNWQVTELLLQQRSLGFEEAEV